VANDRAGEVEVMVGPNTLSTWTALLTPALTDEERAVLEVAEQELDRQHNKAIWLALHPEVVGRIGAQRDIIRNLLNRTKGAGV
jgi:hypothetical protein